MNPSELLYALASRLTQDTQLLHKEQISQVNS